MAKIHAIIQSKGVGKTFVASTLAQYIRDERAQTLLCLDTDTINATLTRFKALQAIQVEISNLEAYCRGIPTETVHVVIDTSTVGFLPFCSQVHNVFLPALTELGHTLHLHTVVAGGQFALDTFNGFGTLARNFPTLSLTVWLNPYWGPVVLNGVNFEESKVFCEHVGLIQSIIRLSGDKNNLFDKDLQQMLSEYLTFEEALNSTKFYLMSKQRIHMRRRDLWEQLCCAVECD